MAKEYLWNVTVDGQEHMVCCVPTGNKYIIWVDDEELKVIYRLSNRKMRYDNLEEKLDIAGKQCLFVVWDERPDLVVDGMFLDRKMNFAQAMEKRKKGFQMTYRIIFWCGIALLLLAAGYLLLNIGKEVDVSQVHFYAISGLILILYGNDSTRWLTQPAKSPIMRKVHNFKNTTKTYLKILLITAMIQIVGFIISHLIVHLINIQIALWFSMAVILCSMIIGIVLPIKWGEKLWHKVLMPFLLPTNYTWILAYYLLIIDALNVFFKILGGNG